MSRPQSVRIPPYQRHKTGQARVRVAGRDYYLGQYGCPPSQEAYRRLIAEWTAKGCPRPWNGPQFGPRGGHGNKSLVVSELILQYLPWADAYYRKNGRSTGEAENIRLSLRPFRDLHGSTEVTAIDASHLKVTRHEMIAGGLARGTINRRIDRIRRMFRWSVGEGLVHVSVYQSLQAVPGLKKGRSEARETEPVRPVVENDLRANFPFGSRPVRVMADLQCLTGMRPGEVISMRPCDITATKEAWVYVPADHKTVFPVLLGAFDNEGLFDVTGNVDPILSGSTITFVAFGVAPGGSVEPTNRVVVPIR